MKIIKRFDRWFVVEVPDRQCKFMGPYKSKADAESCMCRTQKFFDAEDRGRLGQHLNGKS